MDEDAGGDAAVSRVAMRSPSRLALGEVLFVAVLLNALVAGSWMAGQVWLRGAHVTPEQAAAHRQLGGHGLADHHQHQHGEQHHDHQQVATPMLSTDTERVQADTVSSLGTLSIIAATALAEVSDLSVWQLTTSGASHIAAAPMPGSDRLSRSDTDHRPGTPILPPLPPPRLAS